MKKQNKVNIKSINFSDQLSSFDTNNPYRSTFNNIKMRNVPHQQEQAFKITSKFPLSKKASQPLNVSNSRDLDLQFSARQIIPEPMSTRMNKNYHLNQLKSLLSKDKISPTQTTQRMQTQLNTQYLINSPKKNLKTSPDNKLEKLSSNRQIKRVEQILEPISEITPISNISRKSNYPRFHNYFSDNQINLRPKYQLPQPGSVALTYFGSDLTQYEKLEILEYDTVYFIGSKDNKLKDTEKEFDNNKGDYKFRQGDQIAYRFELIDELGHGSFGQVFKVHDHKYNQPMALKMIKNSDKFYNQALIEIEILKLVSKADPSYCLIKLTNYFEFRDHLCMVFELMSCNLYEFIAMNDFNGFEFDLIRRFAIQMLQALLFLKETGIIHCDLKPENILLKDSTKSGIKVIDFGSSCFVNHKMYTYIQSRFYRAPEIVLTLPYSTQIDMWSFGCIVAELYTGQSLFQAKNESELLYLMTMMLGSPDKSFINMSSKKDKYYDSNYQLLHQPKQVQVEGLNFILSDCPNTFRDFVRRCLQWNPRHRMTPEEALRHPWIIEGLPSTIKKQHFEQFMQGQGRQLV